MKQFSSLLVAIIALVAFTGCATGTGGSVMKSEAKTTLFGGEISVGNTIYNVSGEDSAAIVRALNTNYSVQE